MLFVCRKEKEPHELNSPMSNSKYTTPSLTQLLFLVKTAPKRQPLRLVALASPWLERLQFESQTHLLLQRNPREARPALVGRKHLMAWGGRNLFRLQARPTQFRSEVGLCTVGRREDPAAVTSAFCSS